jgi:hypothetical protein
MVFFSILQKPLKNAMQSLKAPHSVLSFLNFYALF